MEIATCMRAGANGKAGWDSFQHTYNPDECITSAACDWLRIPTIFTAPLRAYNSREANPTIKSLLLRLRHHTVILLLGTSVHRAHRIYLTAASLP
ncbi:hypothetical protein TrVGV298_002913 [Trichoderma virens]|nr:hypothetical protein TrVGV298_002913 [Trichoderma virens]